MLIQCTRCPNGVICPDTYASLKDCPFVCENCRCKSCSIVLSFECECGEQHAEPSEEDRGICCDCVAIRSRVADMEPGLRKLREFEIAREDGIIGTPPYRISDDDEDVLTLIN